MTDWKILVADDLSEEGLEILRKHGDVCVFKGMGREQLVAELPGTHALIVRSATKVTADVLEVADELLVVGRAGIGVDNVDVDAATAHGIAVMNTPDSGATTTAEHAISMLCSVARNIPLANSLMHGGRWEKSRLTGVELTGKTLGIVGLGRIGRVVADRARGLAMHTIAFDPGIPHDQAPEGVKLVSFSTLLKQSDFISIHVPLLESTKYLFDADAFEQMKSSARLVHCARGGIVNERALVEALEAGKIAAAALDVFETEPLPDDSPLRSVENLVLTPHLGASTKEAKRNVARDMATQIATCLETGTVINGINVPRIPPNQAKNLAPWLDLVSSLGSFLVQAFPGRIERVSLDLQGDFPQRHPKALRVAALVGALRGAGHAVTSVNADGFAGRNSVVSDVQARVVDRAYVDLVRLEVVLDGRPRFVTGTMLGRHGLTILELENASLDAHPEPNMILSFHEDAPGVMGRIGTTLGERGVNISNMQLALGGSSGSPAMALLTLDGPLSDEVVADLESIDAIERIARIRLEVRNGNGDAE